MRVRDIMTTKVFTIGADKKAFVAKEIMEWAHVHHIPVVDSSNRVVGIISHRDILRASLSALDTRFVRRPNGGNISRARRRSPSCITPPARLSPMRRFRKRRA